MKRKTLVLIMFFCVGKFAWAQDSSLLYQKLKQVDIVEKRASLQQLSLYNTNKSFSLGDLLDRSASNMVKFNGPVGVASINMGGLGGQHTAIVWNGVNLQSSMNGFSDLNLIPLFLFDQIEFGTDFGDQPLGSGLGGSIKLNTTSTRNEILLNRSSFGNYKMGIAISPINKEKLKVGLKFYTARGKNNFNYNNFGTTKRLEHAQFGQNHLSTNISYKISAKSQLLVDTWLMQANREIPPTFFEAQSAAKQDDKNQRASLAYYRNSDNENKSNNTLLRLSILREHIGFTDTVKNITGNNNAQSLFLVFKQGFHKVNYVTDVTTSLFFGGTLGNSSVNTLSYSENSNYNNYAAHVRFQKKGFVDKWLYNIGFKTEKFINHQPYAIDFNYKYRFNEKANLSFFAGKAYKFPSFNDLLWQPGGNPELKPEDALKGHAQIEWNHKNRLRMWAQIHSAYVQNWILWTPNTAGIWQAQNVKTVWARGLDLKYNYGFNKYPYFINLSGNYAFTSTENLGSSIWVNEGTQLSYVPFHKFNQEFKLSYRYFQGIWQHQFIGKRFINPDNSEWLKPYQPDHLLFIYAKKDISLQLALNNIFNIQYQSTAMYPMPGRNYSITLHYNFNSLIKKYVH